MHNNEQSGLSSFSKKGEVKKRETREGEEERERELCTCMCICVCVEDQAVEITYPEVDVTLVIITTENSRVGCVTLAGPVTAQHIPRMAPTHTEGQDICITLHVIIRDTNHITECMLIAAKLQSQILLIHNIAVSGRRDDELEYPIYIDLLRWTCTSCHVCSGVPREN